MIASDDAQQQLARLVELVSRCADHQPTLHLLDGAGAVEWTGTNDGKPLVSLAGHAGVLDPDTERFVPDDPEPIRRLLCDRLRTVNGDAAVPAGSRSVTVEWDTVQIIEEDDGELRALAVAGGTGVTLLLEVDADWRVRAELLDEPPPSDVVAEVELATVLTARVAGDTTLAAAIGRLADVQRTDGAAMHRIAAAAVRDALGARSVSA